MLVASDGVSDDSLDEETARIHERMLVKVAAIATRALHRERLRPLTRFDGAIFTVGQHEALSIWLWNQQVRSHTRPKNGFC
jgi:hypothetical protein